jgi:hypothetical protein
MSAVASACHEEEARTMDEVVIATQLSLDETRRVLRLASPSGPKQILFQLLRWSFLVMLAVPGTIAAMLWDGGRDRSTFQSVILVSLPWVVGVLLLSAIVWLQRRRGVSVWYADPNVPLSLRITAQPEGVHVRWDGFECFQSWQQFDVIFDGVPAILCTNSRLPIIISKRLQTSDELNALREWVMAAVPKRVRSK